MAADPKQIAAKTIEIEIDGQKYLASPNQTVIQVADEAGVYIPRFCYHKHLSIPANCRMCLVEMEKAPKAVPACATPVMAGMKIFTKSAKTVAAQRAVMSFLLINHPLDCPICDQGGECELQDIAMGYGSCHSHYDEAKHCVADQDLGPLIATEMTRCIKCTRCVRFGDEVAGLRELGVIGRGEDSEISTYIQHVIHSEVSGNIIDICPVGALTSKPYRFTARAWELKQAPSVSPHDCVGSNLAIHTRNGKVMRVVSRENPAINHTWIADRDRFSYAGLEAADRLHYPMVKVHGEWQKTDWETALQMAAAGIQKIVVEAGADQVAALLSPSATVEESYLFARLMRGIGSSNIDHRLREIDTRDQTQMPIMPTMAQSITSITESDAICLIGAHLQKEQPILGVHVRQATLRGASVVAINPVDYEFPFAVTAKAIVAPHQWVQVLTTLLQAYDDQAADQTLISPLRDKQRLFIFIGALAMHHPEAAKIRELASLLAEKTKGQLVFLTDGANSAGAWLAGAVPHRLPGGTPVEKPGLSAYDCLANPRRAYLLLNVEPERDCANAAQAIAALDQADLVVACSIYRNPVLEAHANVILPIVPYTETAGTFINLSGEWQRFQGVAKTETEARPAWKVLRILGNFLHLDGFDEESAHEVADRLKAVVDESSINLPEKPAGSLEIKNQSTSVISRIGEIPHYAIDSLVRRSKPLQETQSLTEGDLLTVRMHPATAEHWQLKSGDPVCLQQKTGHSIVFPVVLDERIAREAVWVAGGLEETSALGDLFGTIEIKKA